MSIARSVTNGVLLGAALMYLLDPQVGKRRRALVRDQLVRAGTRMRAASGTTARDVRNRVTGVVATLRPARRSRPASDRVVAERVRAEMGRIVSHPRSIEVSVRDGRVTLAGPILRDEIDRLLARVERIAGVQGVESRLEPHAEAGDVPGLQGGVRREVRIDIRQRRWSPTTRLLAGAGGAALALYGAARRGAPGLAAGAGGAALLARGLTGLELRRLVGVGAGRRAVDLVKTINVAAPVEDVYRFWSDVESFPRFMANVRRVEDRGEGRSHWVVAGPAGAPVEWDAVITRRDPNERLAWETEPGSVVEHAGVVRFQPNADGTTRVHVRMSYNPPAGAVGHAVAALFGADPRSEMDADLARMKTLLETGVPPRDAARPVRETGPAA